MHGKNEALVEEFKAPKTEGQEYFLGLYARAFIAHYVENSCKTPNDWGFYSNAAFSVFQPLDVTEMESDLKGYCANLNGR